MTIRSVTVQQGRNPAQVDPTKITGYVFIDSRTFTARHLTASGIPFQGAPEGLMDSGADRIGARLLFAAVIDDPLCFFQNGLLRCFKTRELAPDAKGP